MRKVFYVALAMIFLFGCAQVKDTSSGVVAKVGNKVITLDEFNSKFSSLPQAYQDSLKDNKEVLLDDIITEEILYEEALKKKIDKDKEIKVVLEEAKKRIVVARLIQDEIEEKVAIEDAVLLEHYNANKDQFMSPEQYRASHILVATLEEAVKIKDQLEKGGSDFSELAEEYSLDVATKKRGGDVNYFSVGQMVPEFEDACVTLNVGETSDVVKTQFGYHIIKLTDKKPSGLLEFDSVKEQIRNQLSNSVKRKAFDKLISDLKAEYKITKNLELLKSFGKEIQREAGSLEE